MWLENISVDHAACILTAKADMLPQHKVSYSRGPKFDSSPPLKPQI